MADALKIAHTGQCESKGGLWSKRCARSQKHSWECPEFQHMIQPWIALDSSTETKKIMLSKAKFAQKKTFF